MKLEIACNSYASCEHAVRGGADRIELFENLPEGGCTPSYGMLSLVKEKIPIPIYMMIRPRGGDFIYSEDEFEIMKRDIEIAHKLQLDGIVFGILNEKSEPDKPRCAELLELWNHKPATFHRAFDRCRDLNAAMKDIIEMGFERVLSSGGYANVSDGREILYQLNQDFGKDIIVMPGAGILSSNVKDIMTYIGATEVHATAKKMLEGRSLRFDDVRVQSDVNEIMSLRQQLNSIVN